MTLLKNPGSNVFRVLNICGFSNIWQQQEHVNEKWIKNAVAQRLKDQFIQTWSNDMLNSSKGKIYSTFKLDFGCEKYLEFRTILLKFRTTNHRPPVETGRWINMPYIKNCR